MIRLELIGPPSAWRPDPDTAASFVGGYRACRVHGASRLVRLTTRGGRAPEGQAYGPNRRDGDYWFAHEDFMKLKSLAIADLRGQGGHTSIHERLGFYMRLMIRDQLAVRRDWTPGFDAYAVLTVPPGKSVVALVGRIRPQPVYSPGVAGAEEARRAGIVLAGGWTQYVIRFDHPQNSQAPKWIQDAGPF